MTLEIWLLFVVTETVLCLSPGPAVLTVVSQGISRGARAGLWTATGVLLANALYFAVSATGLFAIVVAWSEVFTLIKWLGAVYLIWLGVQAWRTSASTARSELPDASATAGWKAASRGFAVQAANPKTLLFFAALLPQFIDAAGAIYLQFAILGLTSIAIEFCVLAMYASFASRAARSVRHPSFAKWANRASGSLLIAAGAGLAAVRRAS